MKIISIKKIISVLILVVIGVLAGYYFFFSLIREKNEEASALSQQITEYANRESMLKNIDRTLEQLGDGIQKVSAYFLQKEDVVLFIETIEGAASKSGLTISINSVGIDEQIQKTPKQKNGTSSSVMASKETFSLRAQVRGAWSDIMHFTTYIENLPYHLNIRRVTVYRVSSPALFFPPVVVVGEGERAVPDVPGGLVPLWNGVFEIEVTIL